MGRYALSSALVAMLASTVLGQTSTSSTTDTTSTTSEGSSTTDATTTTLPLTTVIATTITTDITTVISLTTTTTPITTVVSTTITVEPTSDTTSEATTESTAETTVITTDITTEVTTVIDSTTTVTDITTETVTTVTVTDTTSTDESSSLTTTDAEPTDTSSTSATTTTNAPQYTGATFTLESAEGSVAEGPAQDGTTAQDLLVNSELPSDFTIDGFGRIVLKSNGHVAQTNAGGDMVYVDVAPPTSRVKRQVTGTALTCSVSTNGVLGCTGAGGDVFYTDGTNLYLGAEVPAGFTPITLIAVLQAPITSGTSTSTVAPTGPLPTTGPTTPGNAGWGQWSYDQPTGVPVALTTTVVIPGPGGLQTQTVTVTSMHCGCTETPLPTKIVMTTYVTSCPTEWGYTAPVTVVVPVKPTDAVWGGAGSGSSGSYDNSGWITYGSNSGSGSGTGSGTGSGSGSGSGKGSGSGTGAGAGNGTWNSWNNTPYTGAASPVGVSAGLLSVSVAMLAFLL